MVKEAEFFGHYFDTFHTELHGFKVDDGEDIVGGIDSLGKTELLMCCRKSAAEVGPIFDIINTKSSVSYEHSSLGTFRIQCARLL